jgi:hypothetical protein
MSIMTLLTPAMILSIIPVHTFQWEWVGGGIHSFTGDSHTALAIMVTPITMLRLTTGIIQGMAIIQVIIQVTIQDTDIPSTGTGEPASQKENWGADLQLPPERGRPSIGEALAGAGQVLVVPGFPDLAHQDQKARQAERPVEVPVVEALRGHPAAAPKSRKINQSTPRWLKLDILKVWFIWLFF